MKYLFFILLLVFSVSTSYSQTPTKAEIEAQMQQAIKEIEDSIKDLEKQLLAAQKEGDAASVKDLEEQIDIMKKQLAMMKGVGKMATSIPEETYQNVGAENALPKMDSLRLKNLPSSLQSLAALRAYITKIHNQVEKMIPAAEKAEAVGFYNDTRTEYKTNSALASAASGCWEMGHWEKAVYLMGRACLEDLSDADNLNNYAAFLVGTGGEHAALPILQYLNKMYPNNSTIINNIGQAWFGLGNMDSATKSLNRATQLHTNHSIANGTLAQIYKSRGNDSGAIRTLRAALKETYDPEKESMLLGFGIELTFDDMPDFNYPLKEDPFNMIGFFNTMPENFQTQLNDPGPSNETSAYLSSLRLAQELIRHENQNLDELEKKHMLKMANDPAYMEKRLRMVNTAIGKTGQRSFDLLLIEKAKAKYDRQAAARQSAKLKKIKSLGEILQECQQIYDSVVTRPLDSLRNARTGIRTETCAEVDAVNTAFLNKAAAIKKNGIQQIKKKIQQESANMTNFLRYYMYSKKDTDAPTDPMSSVAYHMLKYDKVFALSFRNNEWTTASGNIGFFVKDDGVHVSCGRPAYNSQNPFQVDGNYLANLRPDELKCEFVKKVKSPVSGYRLVCQNYILDADSKLQKREGHVPPGRAHSGSRSVRRPAGPMSRGPNGQLSEPEFFLPAGPLTSEVKDPSQFSIEYDRWGNMIGCEFQLNEQGTLLLDPETMVTGVENRWSWNAQASLIKGFFHKLVVK